MNWVRKYNTYGCSFVREPFGSAELAQAWGALRERSQDAYLTDGFEWAQACWRTAGAQSGKRLLCPVVRRGGEVMSILPLMISNSGVCRSARPLACETNEYCPALIDATADATAVYDALVSELAAQGEVDALMLPHVRDGSALADYLRHAPGSVAINSMPAPFVERSAFASWEAYWDQRSSRVHANVRRNLRRLGDLGKLEFVELIEPGERHSAWRWMIEHKRDWLARKGEASPFIGCDRYFRFEDATLDVADPYGRRPMFALKLNGQLIAAEFSNLDRRRLEAFVVSYDEAFASYAPGNVLRREVLRWAFARGLDYDWRMGGQAYKLDWASDVRSVATHVLALNGRGRMLVSYFSLRQRLARRASPELRAKLRALVQRPRSESLGLRRQRRG
jgi:CelD/BcsL family acetyltransferase involved in cellulose biosynthesis